MAKIEGPVGVPFKESDNYTMGKGADATTPKRMGPAVGHVYGNDTAAGGVNRAAKGLRSGSGSMASGSKGYAH